MLNQSKMPLYLTVVLMVLSLIAISDDNKAKPIAKSILDEIMELQGHNRKTEAFQMALKHKDDGDPQIWAFIMFCYAAGNGVAADKNKAFEYGRRAEESVPFAKYMVGLFYVTGSGIEQDIDKGWELISTAMERGYKLPEGSENTLMSLLCTPLSEYYDSNIQFQFPGKAFKLQYLQRYFPKRSLGYSLRYLGEEDERLDLYVYNNTGRPVPDGVSVLTKNQLAEAEQAVKIMEMRGVYSNIHERSISCKNRMKKTGIEYEWFSFCYDRGNDKNLRSLTLVFGARGQFFKIRYSGSVHVNGGSTTDNKAELAGKAGTPMMPSMVVKILKQLDTELFKASAK